MKNHRLNRESNTVSYALTRGLGCWELIFEGRHAVLKHERGLFYAACLLYHSPGQPVHGLALALKAAELFGPRLPQAGGMVSAVDEAGGRVMPAVDTVLLERSVELDDAESARRLWRKQRQLEALIESDDECELVKAAAMRELEAIRDFQKENLPRVRSAAQKAARAVRAALWRLQEHLDQAIDVEGHPHPVLGAFAEHLLQYLLRPSSRYGSAGLGGRHARAELAGTFVYEPPAGVTWETVGKHTARG